MSHEGVHTHLLEARSLPTKSVVVYGDRAEVKRIVKCDLYSGRNELIIQNVSAVIERQSLRVDGRDAATIQEVRYQESPIDANSNENDEVHELEERKSELETEKALVDDQLSILRKRVEVLDGVATQISRNISPSTSSTTESRDANANRISACSSSSNAPFVLNENTVTHLTHFLDFYGQTAADLKMQIRKQTKHADSLSQKIDRLERQIDQLRCGLEYDNVKRNISIIVDAEVAAPSEFHVSYQVYCASWKPSYDIRVSTANDKKETTSLTMWYYGVIEQNTGEDWKASELVLSTATPSIGGCVPPLSTLAASFRPRNDGQRKSSWKRKPTSATSDEDMGFGSFDYNELADAAALQRLTACAAQPNSDLQYSSATSYEHLPSTCFAIAHPATILGDGSDHKVTIVKFEMDAKFIHETVPARAAAAYMTALATNTSSLPLLSGPAAVYLNNSFVSKMQLELVLPGEEFYCNLGVDPSLKIEYKAATSIHEQIGFVSKCMLQTHDHVIGVRNAKANQQVQLTVKEHVPKAFDEKIKICVISPDLRSTKAEAYLNEDNNLEWTLCLQPGEQRDLHIKWSIEYPLHETVTYRQIYSVLYV